MLETMKAEIASTGTGLQVKGSCRGFELTFDEPKESGGTDTSVNPVEGLLCAFGACQAIATLLFARMQDVPLDGWRWRATSIPTASRARRRTCATACRRYASACT